MPIAIVIKENTSKFMYDKLSFNQRQQRRSAKKTATEYKIFKWRIRINIIKLLQIKKKKENNWKCSFKEGKNLHKSGFSNWQKEYEK